MNPRLDPNYPKVPWSEKYDYTCNGPFEWGHITYIAPPDGETIRWGCVDCKWWKVEWL